MNPYEGGCPTSSQPFSSGPRDIAEFSYANRPGTMMGGHWIPGNYNACDVDTNSLDSDIGNLTLMIDAYRKQYSNVHFAIVGHSLGGLVALYGATQYMEESGHAGIITRVVTEDSPLHGRTVDPLNNGGAATFNKLNELYASFQDRQQCTGHNDMLGQTLQSMTDNTGNQAEKDVSILKQAGVQVATLGNADDCLYKQSLCFSGLETDFFSLFGIPWIEVAQWINAIPDETSGQFVNGAVQKIYHLGNAGGIPPTGALMGGHNTILSNNEAIDFIVNFILSSNIASVPLSTDTPNPSSTATSTAAAPLNTIDWNNFSYTFTTCLQGTVVVHNGVAMDNGITIKIIQVTYGKLTSNNQVDAVILFSCFNPQGGLIYPNNFFEGRVFVFSGNALSPIMVADLPPSDDFVNLNEACPAMGFPPGSSSYPDPSKVTIANQTLVLDGDALDAAGFGITQTYMWNGQRFNIISTTCPPSGP